MQVNIEELIKILDTYTKVLSTDYNLTEDQAMAITQSIFKKGCEYAINSTKETVNDSL